MVDPTPIQTTLSGISRFIKKNRVHKFRGKSGGNEMVGMKWWELGRRERGMDQNELHTITKLEHNERKFKNVSLLQYLENNNKNNKQKK